MNGILSAAYFLFSLAFGLLTFILWLRVILNYMRVSALNPINQVILKLTNPLLMPINYITKANFRGLDIACLITIALVCLIKFALISVLFFHGNFTFLLMLVLTIADMIVQPLNLLFYAIIIQVILSWVNPTFRNPLVDIVMIISQPVLGAIRRYIPSIANIDFSPLIAIVVIKTITILIGGSLPLNIIG